MNNTFGNSESQLDQDFENEFNVAVHPSSPDQIAIVSNHDGEAVSAVPVRSSASPGTYDMEVVRLPLDQKLVPALKLLRDSHLKLPDFSDETQFLTTVDEYSERTRILALDGEILALNDNELFEWLVNAERQMYLGTDSHPIFEMPLQDTACSFTRLPNGQIAMTEASRESVNRSREKMRSLFGDAAISGINLGVETATRSAARYYLTAVPKGAAIAKSATESELTAFMLISTSGFSYGLWNPSRGLFSEYAFLAPVEVSRQNQRKTLSQISEAQQAQGQKDDKVKHTQAYVKHAIDQLALQLAPDRLDELGLSRYAQVVWAVEEKLEDHVQAVIEKFPTDAGLSFTDMGANIEEAVVGGLLFGSFTFGDETVVGADILPPVNLARDLLVLADKEEVKRRHIGELRNQKRRRQAVFTMLAGPAIVFAFFFAFIADHVSRQTYFAIREAQANAKTEELKPALERRTAYEANLKWYQEFIKQVSRLRKQQPVGIGMLYQLNQNYPFDLDGSFYVEELKLKPDAGIEITGLARNKDAVTAFLRSLEFAGGPESGTRLFSNLTYEVREGVAQPIVAAGQNSAVPTMTDSTLKGEGPAPGVIAWTIRGNYLPMAAFIPPDPKKLPVPGAPAPAAVPAPPPAAAPGPGNPQGTVPNPNP